MLQSLDVLIAFITVILTLSLIVTTFVQIWQSMFQWRGTTLRTALAEMIQQMPLDTKVDWTNAEVCEVADELLRLRAVSPDGKKLGQAIDLKLMPLLMLDVQARLEERGQDKLATKAGLVAQRLNREIKAGSKGLEVVEEFRKRQGDNMLLTADQDMHCAAVKLTDALQKVLTDGEEEVSRFMVQSKSRAQARFDIFIASARERFKRSTQRASVTVALVLCLFYRVDALAVLEGLAADPAQASEVAESLNRELAEESLRASSMEWLEDVNRTSLQALQSELGAAGAPAEQAIANIEALLAGGELQLQRDEFRDRANQALVTVDGEALEASQQSFDRIYDEALLASQKDLFDKQRQWREQLASAAAFPIFRPRAPIWEQPGDWFSVAELRGLVGYLLSALLVSLGAPFWFKILQNLVNLRPVLSTMLEKEERQRPDRPSRLSRSAGGDVGGRD